MNYNHEAIYNILFNILLFGTIIIIVNFLSLFPISSYIRVLVNCSI